MDLTTCSVCVLAGSLGGAAAGLGTARRRSRRRAGRRDPGRTGRSWPGGRAEPGDHGGPRRGREPGGPR
jgi:hypothetical protein